MISSMNIMTQPVRALLCGGRLCGDINPRRPGAVFQMNTMSGLKSNRETWVGCPCVFLHACDEVTKHLVAVVFKRHQKLQKVGCVSTERECRKSISVKLLKGSWESTPNIRRILWSTLLPGQTRSNKHRFFKTDSNI